MKITEGVLLKNHTTFRIGGPARFFVTVKTVEELLEAVAFAREKSAPIFVLGAGSNLLVSDDGFSGLVIKMEIGGIACVKIDEHAYELVSGAGVPWDELAAEAVGRGLYGLENLSHIPGTAGAAAVQNIGAYGSEAKDTLSWVEAFDTEIGKLVKLANSDCKFGYRDSIFKSVEGGKYIITRVAFLLANNGQVKTDYKDVNEYFAQKSIINPTLNQVREAIIHVRDAKLPSLSQFGTAGSFFKNPIITEDEGKKILEKYPAAPCFSVGKDQMKIPAGWIIDSVCGLKGHREGDTGTYQKQALVIVNFGGATADEVKNFSQKIISSVKEKTGIVLEPEVEFVK